MTNIKFCWKQHCPQLKIRCDNEMVCKLGNIPPEKKKSCPLEISEKVKKLDVRPNIKEMFV